jgi:hypothetical protein
MTKVTREYVRVVCYGYNERRREIEIGDKGSSRRAVMLAEYIRLNTAIDRALLLIESGPLRLQIKRALIEGCAFECMFEHFCGRNQFYACKRRIYTEIARLLNVAE